MATRKAQPFDVVTVQREPRSGEASSIVELHRRYAHLSVRLKKTTGISEEDKNYLIASFKALGDGEDPRKIFWVGVKRGYTRKGVYEAWVTRRLFIGLVKELVDPADKKNKSIPLSEALAQAAEAFGYTKSVAKKYWHGSEKERDFRL